MCLCSDYLLHHADTNVFLLPLCLVDNPAVAHAKNEIGTVVTSCMGNLGFVLSRIERQIWIMCILDTIHLIDI